MLHLKKKIIYHNIENFLLTNNLILVFHYQNIKAKEWVLVKNKLDELTDFDFLTVKNKIACTVLNQNRNSENNDNNNLQKNSIIKEKYCHNKKSFDSAFFSKNKENRKCKNDNVETAVRHQKKTATLFSLFSEKNTNKGFFACLQGPTLIIKCLRKKNNDEIKSLMLFMNKQPNFIFVAGFLKNKALTHLDLEKMQKLDSSNSIDFIKQLELSMQHIFKIKKSLDISSLTTYPALAFLKILQLKKLQ